MIEFKIMQCPERSQVGNYQHATNEITFGASEGDMIIDDPDIAERQTRIFLSGNSFLVENLDPTVEIKLNGRPLTEKSPIKTRDSLTIGRTTIQMSFLDPAPPKLPEPFTHPQADARFTEGSKESAMITVLKHLSEESGPAKPPSSLPPPLPGASNPPPLPKKGS